MCMHKSTTTALAARRNKYVYIITISCNNVRHKL